MIFKAVAVKIAIIHGKFILYNYLLIIKSIGCHGYSYDMCD